MPTIGDDRRFVIEQWNRLFGGNPTREQLDRQVGKLRAGGMGRTEWVGWVTQHSAEQIVTRTFRKAGIKAREGDPFWNKAVWQLASGKWDVQQLNQVIADKPGQLLRDTSPPIERRKDSDAFLRIRDVLRRYGLGDLAKWAWEQLQDGHSVERIHQDLRETKPYQQRFRGLELRRKQGYAAMSEEEYLAYETSVRQMMRAAGMPEGFYDEPDDFARLIGSDVSLSEMQTRIMDGYAQVMAAPQGVRDQLRRFYGLREGELAAWFIDEDRATQAIQRRVAAANIADAARASGFGQINRRQAGNLAELGVTRDEADEGFATLAESQELFGALPGEEKIGRGDQFGAVFGNDTDAQARIRRRVASRQTQSSGAGGFGLGSEGVVGLGDDY